MRFFVKIVVVFVAVTVIGSGSAVAYGAYLDHKQKLRDSRTRQKQDLINSRRLGR